MMKSDVAVRIFRERFLNRTDTVAIGPPMGGPKKGTPRPIMIDPKKLDPLLLSHVDPSAPDVDIIIRNDDGSEYSRRGRYRVGTYCPGPDGNVKWICIDYDGVGHADALIDPRGVAIQTYRRFIQSGLLAHLECSGSGLGWHLWCFFERPIPAIKARALAHLMVPTDAPLAGGGIADPFKGRGIEVFPKQATLHGGKGYGNLLWLPWHYAAPVGANRFYNIGEHDVSPYDPFDLATNSPEQIAMLLEPAESSSSSSSGPTHTFDGSIWADWRRRALAALPLESVYGAFLTGKKGANGWLKCRDPDSLSGDRTPSAGVADGTGDAERGSFHSFRTGETKSVFDYLIERAGHDFRGARDRIALLSGVPLPGTAPPRRTSSTSGRAALPEIAINQRQISDIVQDAWGAMMAAGTVFGRGGQAVRLSGGEPPSIETMTSDDIYSMCSRVATWVRITPTGPVMAQPLDRVARCMKSEPHPDLLRLDAVLTTPVIGADGELIQSQGYHAKARIWMAGQRSLRLPETPTVEQIEEARSMILDDLLGDFPFATQSDRAHSVGAMLLPFVRAMVDGPTPLHMIEAPTPGTGKSLLGDVIAIIATGRSCDVHTCPTDEDEMRKKITSILVRGATVVLLDNLKGGLASSTLAAALTSDSWSDRILGQTRTVTVSNLATWIATANNPSLTTEVARRCVRIRLDAQVERPWDRRAFRHTNLRAFASQHRWRMVEALLTLARAWAVARYDAGHSLGSFESWAMVIGGILDRAGIPGFLGRQDELFALSDTEAGEWDAFISAWLERFGDRWVAANELFEVRESEMLADVAGGRSPLAQRQRLGRALMAKRGRCFGAHRLETGKDPTKKVCLFRLVAGSGVMGEKETPSTNVLFNQ